jgi:hypothetical protein
LKIERQCSPFLIIDPCFDVYDTTLPTNSLIAKSIQILTVASRFLTALHALDTYISNMSVRPAGSVCVSEADKSSCSLSHVGAAIVLIFIKLQPASHRHHGNRGEGLICFFAATAGAFTDYGK